MSIALRGTPTAHEVDSTAPVTAFVCAKPAGLAVGDLLVAEVYTNGANPSLPAGWTDIVDMVSVTNPKGRVMYKVADATDAAAASFTFPVASTYGDAILRAFTGVDGTTPIDFAAITFASTTNVTAFTLPSGATAGATGAHVIGGAAANTGPGTGTWTEPAGWNPADYTPAVGKSCCSSRLGPVPAGGTIDPPTWTLSVARAGDAWMAGLKPAATATPASARTGSLKAELNRLAGTTNLAETAAANAWAGTTGLALIGALNAKAGTSGLALAGVCNRIAGTTNLSAVEALQRI